MRFRLGAGNVLLATAFGTCILTIVISFTFNWLIPNQQSFIIILILFFNSSLITFKYLLFNIIFNSIYLYLFIIIILILFFNSSLTTSKYPLSNVIFNSIYLYLFITVISALLFNSNLTTSKYPLSDIAFNSVYPSLVATVISAPFSRSALTRSMGPFPQATIRIDSLRLFLSFSSQFTSFIIDIATCIS